MAYREPELSYLVLDFLKEKEARQCLESIKERTKFEHKVIYLHNGEAAYAHRLFEEGLVDHFIQTAHNAGVSIGTRNLFAASFSPYSFYIQNDQYLKRDFTQAEFYEIKGLIGGTFRSPEDGSAWTAQSVDLAGGWWGLHTYSDRGLIMPTAFYRDIERQGILEAGGPGPYESRSADRENSIQRYYKAHQYLHYTYENPLVESDGWRAIRENADGSIWEQHADTNEVWLRRGPVQARGTFPRLSEAEWEEVIRTQRWPDGAIPEYWRKQK